jgi:hypothetical protein
MDSAFDRAMAVVKAHVESDPFYTGELRKFYVAVKCLLKSAETGKGVYLARKRHIKTIYDYAIEVADVTGTIEVIMEAVEVAAQKITSGKIPA